MLKWPRAHRHVITGSMRLLQVGVILMTMTTAANACQLQKHKPALTPEEVFQQKEDLIGQDITVQGTVLELWRHCTEEECPEQNPCCNACWCGVGFWVDVSGGREIALSGSDINCSGDGCTVTCRPFEFGVTYVITGNLRDSGGSSGLKASTSSLYLDVVDFTISD